jgi:hypothetical protein
MVQLEEARMDLCMFCKQGNIVKVMEILKRFPRLVNEVIDVRAIAPHSYAIK